MIIKSIDSDSTQNSIRKIDLEINELKTQYRNGEYKKFISVEINQKDVTILFNLFDDEDISERQIYIEEETELMFFMTDRQYGIIDLKTMEILEQNIAFTFGFPERLKNSIIFDDEISAKSYTITGKFIDEVPIDPPTDRIDYEEYLEYKSPVYGKTKLKID